MLFKARALKTWNVEINAHVGSDNEMLWKKKKWEGWGRSGKFKWVSGYKFKGFWRGWRGGGAGGLAVVGKVTSFGNG